jgi:hypothetical protein
MRKDLRGLLFLIHLLQFVWHLKLLITFFFWKVLSFMPSVTLTFLLFLNFPRLLNDKHSNVFKIQK